MNINEQGARKEHCGLVTDAEVGCDADTSSNRFPDTGVMKNASLLRPHRALETPLFHRQRAIPPAIGQWMGAQ